MDLDYVIYNSGIEALDKNSMEILIFNELLDPSQISTFYEF